MRRVAGRSKSCVVAIGSVHTHLQSNALSENKCQLATEPAFKRRARVVRDQKQHLLSEHHDILDLPRHASVGNERDGVLDAVDGNEAVAHVAYALSEVACVYPITPATSMGEVCDAKAALGVLNCFDQKLSVVEMESEGGVAGALHGAAAAGALAVTFTSSQGLLLMIPNMYKLAGELTPCVIHVAARPLSMAGTTLYPDHQDVMAVRQTGWTILCSESPQMAHDMAIVAHLGALASSVPVLHFFDGFRTSHEINKVELASYANLKNVIPTKALESFRLSSLSPTRPTMRGMSMGSEAFFAQHEAGNTVRESVPTILSEIADSVFKQVTNRSYAFYAYEGAADAEHIVVVMGSAAVTCEQAVIAANNRGMKCGVLKVRLFRPFCIEAFVEAIPITAKVVTVLDRVAEPFAAGEPLYLDVAAALSKCRQKNQIVVLKGRYGIGGAEFTPGMALGVLQNGFLESPRDSFSVGIQDDVTGYSLEMPTEEPNVLPAATCQCLMYGVGGDGTVTATKLTVKALNSQPGTHAQAFFEYDAKKNGGLTTTHLRFGPHPISAPYAVQSPDVVVIHKESYVRSLDTLKKLKPGGTVILNTSAHPTEGLAILPLSFRRKLAALNAQLFFIDASKVAAVCGLGKTINFVMQVAFLNGVALSQEKKIDKSCIQVTTAINQLSELVRHALRRKDSTVISNNVQAMTLVQRALYRVDITDSWLSETDPGDERPTAVTTRMPHLQRRHDYYTAMSAANRGQALPVSAFTPGGATVTSTSWREKRGTATQIPLVDMNKCVQCTRCSVVCPHAAIRPFLMTDTELRDAPASVKCSSKPAKGEELDGLSMRLQASPLDCTGCQLCSKMCPVGAISMTDATPNAVKEEGEKWDYLIQLPQKPDLLDKSSVKGSQLQQPLFEFSAACEGCGETPYLKLLTQLFGSQLVIANASGCSSVVASSAPSVAYTVNERGEGPAWGNSLFEDNAQYGFGMQLGHLTRRKQFLALIGDVVKHPPRTVSPALLEALQAYLTLATPRSEGSVDDPLRRLGKTILTTAYRRIAPLLAAELGRSASADSRIVTLNDQREFFMKLNFWTVGGDGWAYDIGFGGLDHVLHSGGGVDSKILVLDTEGYSNTGGQHSKSTPIGVQTKFSESGKDVMQKDLCHYAMSLKNVYVASVSLHANPDQTVRALLEADAYPGPALVVCYSPCIAHGMPMSESIEHSQQAVASGYWPLYRYNPLLAKAGNNPFQLDSHRISAELLPFLKSENRFASLMRSDGNTASALDSALQHFVMQRERELQAALTTFGIMQGADDAAAGPKTYVAYGSETGHAAEQAQVLMDALVSRGETNVRICTLDELPLSSNFARDVRRLFVVVSTCGIGELPRNAREFYQKLSSKSLPLNFLEGVEFAVFGLGDNRYQANFCAAAERIDVRLGELGAKRVHNRGIGDDQEPEHYFRGWERFESSLLVALNLHTKPLLRASPRYKVEIETTAGTGDRTRAPDWALCPKGFTPVTRIVHRQMTPADYDRVICHHEFLIPMREESLSSPNVSATPLLKYKMGDSLAVQPEMDPAVLERLLAMMPWGKLGDAKLVVSASDPTPGASAASHFPPVVSLHQLLTHFIDVSRRPPKHFFARLSAYAKDPREAEELRAIGGLCPANSGLRDSDAAAQPCSTYQTVREKGWNVVDVFERFESCRDITLPEFLTIVPRSMPRFYSISSSPRASPDRIHITTLRAAWDAKPPKVSAQEDAKPLIERRFGLCSSFLSRKSVANDTFFVRVQKGSIKLPPQHIPLIVTGTGTGLAPWRGTILDRAYAVKTGEVVGPVLLYFGSYTCKEYLYKEDFASIHETLRCRAVEGAPCTDEPLLTVRTAFSHDQADRIFVQHRMMEDRKLLADWFLNRGAHFRLCGAARSAAESISTTIRNILETEGNMSAVAAEAQFVSWQREGRIAFETY